MADPMATITLVAGQGMITIRADLDRAGDALAEAAGLAIPGTTGLTFDGSRMLAWMSPDELLLIAPLPQIPQALSALTDALTGEHGLVADLSDARVMFDVTGPHAADVIAKLAPVDAARMAQGHVRRTRIAQVAAAIWRIEGGFRVIGFRSSGDYLRLVLTNAALPGSQLAPR